MMIMIILMIMYECMIEMMMMIGTMMMMMMIVMEIETTHSITFSFFFNRLTTLELHTLLQHIVEE